MNPLSLTVAIACLDDDYGKVESSMADLRSLAQKGVEVLIVHQKTTASSKFSEAVIERFSAADIRYIVIAEKGLPRSRNLALERCSTDLLYATDADVEIDSCILEKIAEAFQEYPSAAALTFKAYNKKPHPYKRDYKDCSFQHNKITLLAVSSIELVINASRIKQAGLQWHPLFGLGAKIPTGLESVFVQNIYAHKLPVYYFPRFICDHEGVSSGRRTSPEMVTHRTCVFMEIFGNQFGWLVSLLFHLKRYRRFSGNGFLRNCEALVVGYRIGSML